MPGVVETLAYQATRGACAAVLEHLPDIEAFVVRLRTTTAVDASQPPEAPQVTDAVQGAIARGDAPGGPLP